MCRAAKLGMKIEWLGNGNVKTISGPLPAIKLDEKRGQKVWFNSMVAAYTGWDDVRNDPKRAVILGDGSLLPEEAILGCLSILHEESVLFHGSPAMFLYWITLQFSMQGHLSNPLGVFLLLCASEILKKAIHIVMVLLHNRSNTKT